MSDEISDYHRSLRLVHAAERIADALAKLAGLEEKKFQKAYPKEKPRRPAVIERPSDEKKEQYSDRADSEWIGETEQVASRFQKRFDDSKSEPQP